VSYLWSDVYVNLVGEAAGEAASNGRFSVESTSGLREGARMAPDGAARQSGLLTQVELKALEAAGEIDTVIVAFADMQGRLTGKRVAARLFVEEVAAHGAECCNYLLAVDVDMNTVDGYRMSSWESGYGDMVMTPDFATLRLVPWLPGTALVMADLSWVQGGPVTPAPRTILNTQLKRLADRGLAAFIGTELEFMVFDATYIWAGSAKC
jgi:glutamine synthetase